MLPWHIFLCSTKKNTYIFALYKKFFLHSAFAIRKSLGAFFRGGDRFYQCNSSIPRLFSLGALEMFSEKRTASRQTLFALTSYCRLNPSIQQLCSGVGCVYMDMLTLVLDFLCLVIMPPAGDILAKVFV